ncbi:hypothetical protein DdX_01727 [Ditylenchus destructor]|uniref:Uncharacterized protein n=1 Tax=Ditylenchus destructor TaxID=166010 RepID=A0AAD4RE40_9BILA|nr:hypothetical protein DdX_01727 [Ditylenchus destructor]
MFSKSCISVVFIISCQIEKYVENRKNKKVSKAHRSEDLKKGKFYKGFFIWCPSGLDPLQTASAPLRLNTCCELDSRRVLFKAQRLQHSATLSGLTFNRALKGSRQTSASLLHTGVKLALLQPERRSSLLNFASTSGLSALHWYYAFNPAYGTRFFNRRPQQISQFGLHKRHISPHKPSRKKWRSFRSYRRPSIVQRDRSTPI